MRIESLNVASFQAPLNVFKAVDIPRELKIRPLQRVIVTFWLLSIFGVVSQSFQNKIFDHFVSALGWLTRE